ncbi:4-coumarate-CoA ligase, putative [Parvularcula bermudensis HTCC2503]|uniref:4-coumarate-CoA ligase, putative n=1 Tax=Parvularcula bermudensis (strain ATCC BAA-594 / HTCC2503 / KCTC 12087) TaxID=314260 RepID=E0TG99_PARBH|nr:AMP-binding protein [Parvularcula bermudensis]ADM09142.1 4-coumarate-CoA ligase, putative [Parvularcula bermudensis HTCC2503]
MDSFTIKEPDLVKISASLTADELARRFGQYTETLTLSRWDADTPLGAGGVEATPEQRRACGLRFTQFFDLEAEALETNAEDRFGQWAARLFPLIRRRLTSFRFYPATPAGYVDTRHNADDIYQDAAAVASLIQGRRRVFSLVQADNLMGLVSSVLAPSLLRLEVVDGRGLGPDELAEAVQFGDLIIATPTLWRYLAETLPDLPDNVMGLTFGERFSPELARQLRSRGVGAMRELYGSTETGVVGWRDSPPDPFSLFRHWSRGEGSAIIRSSANGRPYKMLPMDDLSWTGPSQFDLGARRDGAIQIGGVNVFPTAIAATIAEHPMVSQCSVRVSQRPGALDRLITDIVLADDIDPDEKMAWSIDEWCRRRLRPTERPRIYNFADQLPEDNH